MGGNIRNTQISMDSLRPSTAPPDLNFQFTEMESPLVNKLMDCAKAIAHGEMELAGDHFTEIGVLTDAEANEVTKKIVNYFAEALARRVHGVHPPNPVPLVSSAGTIDYSKVQQNPLYQFASITTNYDFLQTLITGRSKPFHFIDFSMEVSYMYWKDWISYYADCVDVFQLTTIMPKLSKLDDDDSQNVCKRVITPLAQVKNIDFQYRVLFANTAVEIAEQVLKLERTSQDETIVVRWVFELHKLLAEEGAMQKVLSKLKDLRPDIMVIVEQEANNNSSDFFTRFTSSFDYYRTLFESSEQGDIDPRTKLSWEMQLRRQITNLVASEGSDRLERHERLACWQERLGLAGFRSIQLWSNELRNRLPKFRIVENNGFPMLCFGDNPLAVVSVWRPANPILFNYGADLNYPITINDTSTSSPIETEALSSSDSDGDEEYDPDSLRNGRIWSTEEVRHYLVSSFTLKEMRRIGRWIGRKMSGNFAGRDKKLDVRDTSLASLLRIPPLYGLMEEDPRYYVDDPVIDAYFELLRRRSEKFPSLYIKIYSLPTWTMRFLLSGKWSETKVLSCLKMEAIVGKAKLFIPVCLENHWILICVDMEKQTLLWLDSLYFPFEAHLLEKTRISEWIKESLLPRLGYPNANEWQFLESCDNPKQTNRVDCGIFVMKYADCLAHGDDHFPFTQQDIPHFRYRVFLDIYRGKLSAANSVSSSRKVDPDRWEFADEGFLVGQEPLQKDMEKRRHFSHNTQQQSDGAYVESREKEMEFELERLRRDKNVLMQDIVRLRQLQQQSRLQIAALEERSRSTERRQQQMMAFLAKACKNDQIGC